MVTTTLARNLARAAARRVYHRLMDRVGGRLIAGMADTSADAPNAFYEPKRDVYRQIVEEEERQGVVIEAADR
jgi:hypothetical protein